MTKEINEKNYAPSEELLMKSGGIEMTQNISVWEELSTEHNIPSREIKFIDFNRSGVCLPNEEVRVDYRVRFTSSLGLEETDETWFALPVRRVGDTNFIANEGKLLFKNEIISNIGPLILDTCNTNYQRGPTLLNLNSRSRGNCGGCKACVHNYKDLYDGTVIKDQQKLISKEEISTFFDEKENEGLDLPGLQQIAVVTGLFGSETEVVKHMKLIQEVVKPRGFKGELMYFGCEVNSEAALDELANLGKFSLIYAIDNFTKRKELLTKTKSLINIETAKKTLSLAKQKGIDTTYAYIAGIDNLTEMKKGFEYLMDSITRFPVINIYQVQTSGQIAAMDLEAKTLSYYAKARKITEELFKDTNMTPRRWENYRPLWYEEFNGKPLPKNAFGD